MLLASIALAAQIAANQPGRAAVNRPCADPSALCRISPFFCPGTYPAGLEPCWPEQPRQTRSLANRPAGASVRHEANPAAASRPAPPRATWKTSPVDR